LVSIFGEPDADTATDFFTAASFLAYSNNLRVVRVVGEGARNAYNGGSTAPVIENSVDYESKVSSLTGVKFIAKYPGDLGNSIRVSFAGSAAFESWEYRSLFGSSVTLNKIANITSGSGSVTSSAPRSTASLAGGMSVLG